MGDLFAAADARHSLFFALLPGPAEAAAIRAARQALEAGQPPQRGAGVPDERLHLTLHWLGEWSQLPQALADDARAAAAQVRQAGFVLRLDQAECFGRGEAIWVLRPSAPPPALERLHQALATALAGRRIRLPAGPAFAPHVTVRRRASVRFPVQPVAPVDWRVDGFALLQSVHGSGGVRYEVLQRWPLAAE